jgi:uncharacterized protein YndB with AHSA1/START domain
MENIQPIVKEVTLDASVTKVWQALTDKEQFASGSFLQTN